MARLHGRLGRNAESLRLLDIVSKEDSPSPTLVSFYQALALEELGKSDQAAGILRDLENEAASLIDGSSENHARMSERNRQALGKYYQSKILAAKGNLDRADDLLIEAKSLLPGIEREAVMIAQRAFARAIQ